MNISIWLRTHRAALVTLLITFFLCVGLYGARTEAVRKVFSQKFVSGYAERASLSVSRIPVGKIANEPLAAKAASESFNAGKRQLALTFDNNNALTVTGTVGDDVIHLVRKGDDIVATGGAGVQTNLPLTASLSGTVKESLGGIVIDGLDGDDRLDLDFSGGNFNVPITFNGGNQATTSGDSLRLFGGNFATGVSTPTNGHDGSIVYRGGMTGDVTVNYTGLEPIDDLSVVADYTINATNALNFLNIVNGPEVMGTQTTQVNDGGGGFELLNVANKATLRVNALNGSDQIFFNNNLKGVGINTFEINGNDGDDQFSINSPGLVAGTSYTFNGGNDNDLFNISGGLLTVPITINGDAHTGGTPSTQDRLTVNCFASNVTQNATQLSFSGGSTITYATLEQINLNNLNVLSALVAGAGDIAVQGTAGNDVILLKRNGANYEITPDAGTISISLAGPAAIGVNGLSGNDRLDVDFSGGTFSVPINYDGGANSGTPGDTLRTFGGNFATGVSTPTSGNAGTIVYAGGTTGAATINYTGLEPIDELNMVADYTINATSGLNFLNIINGPVVLGTQTTQVNDGAVLFELQNVANKATLRVNALGGSDQISLNNSLKGVGINTFEINGEDGNDQFNINSPGLVTGTSYTFNGGNDNDLFNISGGLLTVPITINGDAHTGGTPSTQDRITVNCVASNVTQSGSQLLFTGGSAITHSTLEQINLNNLNTLSVSGTGAADAIVLNKPTASEFRSILNGGIEVNFTMPLAAVGAQYFANPAADSDTLLVDNTSRLVNLRVAYNAGTGTNDTLNVFGNPGAPVARESYIVGASQDVGQVVLDPDGNLGYLKTTVATANGDELDIGFTGLDPINTDVPAVIFDVTLSAAADNALLSHDGTLLNGFQSMLLDDIGGTFETTRFANKATTTVAGFLSNDTIAWNAGNLAAGLTNLEFYGFLPVGLGVDDHPADPANRDIINLNEAVAAARNVVIDYSDTASVADVTGLSVPVHIGSAETVNYTGTAANNDTLTVIDKTTAVNPARVFNLTSNGGSYTRNNGVGSGEAGPDLNFSGLSASGTALTLDGDDPTTVPGDRLTYDGPPTATFTPATATSGDITAAGLIGVYYQNYECFTSTAVVSGSTTICAGGSATVTVTIAGSFAPYTVTLNNGGGTLTGNSPLVFTVSPTTNTTYSIQSATDMHGCTVSASGSATISVNPKPSVNPVTPAAICSTGTTNIPLTSTPASASFTWTVSLVSGTVTGFANGAGNTIAQTLAGNGVVKYTVTATLNGCLSDPVDILQTVNSAPTITTQPFSQAVCEGGSVTFTAAANGVPTPTVQWQLSTNGGGTFADIPGETSTSLTVSNVTAAMNTNQYRAVFTNTCGTTPTNAATLTVNRCTISFADPQSCTGPGDAVTGTFSVTNNGAASATVLAVVALPAAMPALAGSCTNCTINNSTNISLNTTLAPGQTVTATFLAQISDQVLQGTVLTSVLTVQFNSGPLSQVQTQVTANCPAVGPGTLAGPANAISDQKPGSVLVYPIYSSSASNASSQNTRIAITNTNPARTAYIHLFFVDGSSCSVADSYICLTPNQTATVLASDIDPGTTGYLIAVAVNEAGCPISFNHLIGDEYVKLASGHQSNLGAESIAAVAGGLTACNPLVDNNAVLAFNNVSYNALPRVLASSNIPSRGDGNDTYVVIDRIGGNLSTSGSTIGGLFGILYDDAEAAYSFSLPASACQSAGSITNDRPRVVPRFETVIPSGRTGWFKIWGASDIGILGSQINRNANAATNAAAFNHGHNLHKLTLTTTATLTIPVFPPSC